MQLLQYVDKAGNGRVVVVPQGGSRGVLLPNLGSSYALVQQALRSGSTLRKVALDLCESGQQIDLREIDWKLRLPIDHPDPARMFVTGTGLTHLGSAQGRQQMHERMIDDEAQLTDSMKMFQKGLSGGRPEAGAEGVQPEWFYKGNGHTVVASGDTLSAPGFSRDASEEPELVGVYVIDGGGVPRRVGFSLGNELSDHEMEQENYLYLAHSKLRPASVGPSLLLGEPPTSIEGMSRIIRNGVVAWEKPFFTGEDNMSHSLENLERHHFKYPLFRQPGDVHFHFFGTSTLSYSDGFRTQDGDIFEIEAAPFLMALRNPLRHEAAVCEAVRPL